MCKWYCTSEGPSTNLECLHCHAHYCGACLNGDAGKMVSLIKCASCGKKPRVKPAGNRGQWQGAVARTPPATSGYTPSTAIKQGGGNSPKKSPTGSSSTGNNPSIFDKLTDTSLYTGSHKHRFGADGSGLGLEGRDSVAKGMGNAPAARTVTGSAVDLSQMVRQDVRTKPSPAPSTSSPSKTKSSSSSSGKPSIFDKLTDSSQYTGSHKHRFDSAGNGRGMSGRDAASGIEYGSGKVSSLAQIMRN